MIHYLSAAFIGATIGTTRYEIVDAYVWWFAQNAGSRRLRHTSCEVSGYRLEKCARSPYL